MQMPGRKYDSGSWYRYGFNGKKNDKEDGIVQYDYRFRIYDPRLSRFKSVDPLCKSYPMLSPFQFASNSPIFYIDIDGMEGGRYSIPGNETLLLPTNAIVSQKFVQTKQRQLMGFDTKVNVQKGQLQSFQIGNELYQANWNVNTSEFAGYYSGKKKYVPEVEPNIGIVMTVDAAIGKQCIPLNPPQDITWEMPAIFDYDRALENDMTPDAMTHSVSLDGAGPTYGGSEEATATTISKGKDASVFPYLSTSYGTGAQFPIDLGASVGASKGLVWSLDANQGYQFTRDMIAGPQVSGSFSMSGAIGAKGTLNFSIDLSLANGANNILSGA